MKNNEEFSQRLMLVKVYAVEIAATIFFLAFVLAFLWKELKQLF